MNDLLAKNIMEAVGGHSNIQHLTHCATRLRFNLFDEKLFDEEKLKENPEVIGVTYSSDQYQVIVGNIVEDAFKELNELRNSNESNSEVENENKSKQKIDIIGFISGDFTPVLPVITGAGMLQAVIAIAAAFGLSSESPTYLVLSSVANAGF